MLQLITGGGLGAVVEDASPQLGGDLDGQSIYDLVNMVHGTFSGKGTFGSLAVDTNVLVVDAVTNRVGINEPLPGTALEVNGDISVPIGMKYYFANIDNPTYYMQYVSGDGLYFIQAGLTSLKLGSTGQLTIGMGCDTPSLAKLQVQNTNTQAFVGIRQTSYQAQDGESLFTGMVATWYSYIGGNCYYRTSSLWRPLDTEVSAIRFDDGAIEFYADSSLTEGVDFTPTLRVKITVDGKLGIGTVTPTANIHVVGLDDYLNNAAALTAGLTPGAFYRTGGDPDVVCVVH